MIFMNMKKNCRLIMIGILILGMFTLLSCKNDQSQDGEMVLKLNNMAEPQSLDPAIMTGVVEHFIGYSLFEGLVNYHPEDGSPTPGLAKSWEVSGDLKVFTFKMRDNAVWSDGVKITAHTIKKSWLRTLDPATASEYVFLMFGIKKAKDFYDGNAKAEEVGVTVIDDYTLEVTLENPTPYFPSLLLHYSFYPVPLQAIEKYGNDKWYKPENIVVNGPFALEEWVPQQHIIMVKNDKYWDKDAVKLDKIICYPTEDNNTAVEMFMNNEIDWSRDFADERIDELKDMPETKTTPQLGTYFYRMNMENEYLKDQRVRYALSLAINRDDICKYVTKGGQIPAYSICPPMAGYTPPEIDKMDLEKAKKLMAEAGYPGGEGFPEMTILYNTNENHKRIAEAIQQMWKETLGIDVVLVNEEWKVYLDRMTRVDFEICRAGWLGDYNDPNTFLDMFLSYSDMNQCNYRSDEYDSMVEKAAAEVDPAKRMKLLRDAETLFLSDLPAIPIYFYVNKNLVHKNVKGWYDNVLDVHPPKEIYIEQ